MPDATLCEASSAAPRTRQRAPFCQPRGAPPPASGTAHHVQHTLDLAAKVGVTGRVDNIDVGALVGERRILRQDSDAALPFLVIAASKGSRARAATQYQFARARSRRRIRLSMQWHLSITRSSLPIVSTCMALTDSRSASTSVVLP